jgi:putative hydrolase of the HAD superfamily
MPSANLRAREKAWWHAVVREVFAATPVADFDGYFDDLFTFFASAAAWRVDPDAAPLLTRLRTAGVRILVVSNFDARVRGVLAALGLADLVDQITISSEAGAAKPDPRIFATALAAAGLRPSEVLHVGDTAREDLAAARAAGLEVVLVGGDDLAVEAPDATRVPRLADIEAVMARRLR